MHGQTNADREREREREREMIDTLRRANNGATSWILGWRLDEGF